MRISRVLKEPVQYLTSTAAHARCGAVPGIKCGAITKPRIDGPDSAEPQTKSEVAAEGVVGTEGLYNRHGGRPPREFD